MTFKPISIASRNVLGEQSFAFRTLLIWFRWCAKWLLIILITLKIDTCVSTWCTDLNTVHQNWNLCIIDLQLCIIRNTEQFPTPCHWSQTSYVIDMCGQTWLSLLMWNMGMHLGACFSATSLPCVVKQRQFGLSVCGTGNKKKFCYQPAAGSVDITYT